MGLALGVITLAATPASAWPPPASATLWLTRPDAARVRAGLYTDAAAELERRIEEATRRMYSGLGVEPPRWRNEFGTRVVAPGAAEPAQNSEPDREPRRIGDIEVDDFGARTRPWIYLPMPPQSVNPWGATPRYRIRNYSCDRNGVVESGVIEVEAWVFPIAGPGDEGPEPGE